MLALDRSLRRARRGFTLIELVVVIVVVALLTSIGLVSYNAITTDTKRKQAFALLDGVAAAQQSWYRSRGTFVSFNETAGAADGRTTLESARTQQLLKRIAPGTEDARTRYVASDKASSQFGEIAVSRVLGKDNLPRLFMGMRTETNECVGTVVVPPGSPLASVPAKIIGGLPCTTAKVQAALGDGAPSASTAKPGTPVNLRLTPAPGRILLTWQAPASNGANAPSSYVVTDGAGQELMSVDAAITSYADGTLSPLDPAKAYAYQVISRNAAGDSAPATPTPTSAKPLDPATTAPDRPTNVSAAWNAGIQLSWSPSGIDGASAATGYEIRRDGQTIACLGKDICAARGYTGQDLLSLTYLDAYSSGSTIKLGATYQYDIRALNQVAGGTSAWASTQVTTPPGPPTAVSATPVPGVNDSRCPSPTCVALNWKAPAAATGAGVRPADLTGYRIYRGTTATFTPGDASSTLVGTVDGDATGFTDRSLPGAATYYYKVAATNANKDASTNYATSPAVSTVTAAPSLSAATGTSAGTIKLTWTVPATKKPITGYNVYRLDDDATASKIATTTATSFTDSGSDLTGGLSPFTGYTYTVAAVTADGVGMPSGRASALAPNAPVRTASTAATATSLTLRWDRVPGATYIVARTGSPTTWTTTQGRITDTGLQPGTRYTYTITTRATDPSTGLSSDVVSQPFSGVTEPAAPTALDAAPSGRNVTLTWTPPATSSLITGYRVMRCLELPCDPSNLPKNPSLETAYTGSTTWWYGARGTAVRTAATSTDGTYSLRYTATETMAVPTAAYTLPYGPGPAGANLYKYPVTPGQSVTASMDVRGDATSPSDGGSFDVGLSWIFYRADGTSLTTFNAPFTRLDPTSWKSTTLTTVVPAGAAAAYPVLYGRRAGGYVPGDGWYVDNARVTGTGVTTIDIAAPATTWTDTNLPAGTAYGYAISAVTAGGEGAASAPVATATIPNPVTASIDAADGVNITLSWTKSPVATGYDVLRNGVYLTTVPAGTTTFTDGSRLGGTPYTYVVRAKNDAGSADSNPVSASTTPDPPTGVAANAGATSVALSWLSTGADGYQILRCTGAGCDATATGTVVATLTTAGPRSWTNTGLAAQTWYGYAVKAGRSTTVGGVTTWSWSAASMPILTKTVLDPPTNLTVGTLTPTSVALTWSTSPGATSYRIYRDGVKLGAAPATTSFTDTGLVPGMRYTYTVTAAAANGEESGQSGQVSAITVLPAPTGLAVSNSTTSGVTLRWSAVTGATSYQVMGCALPCSAPTSWGVTANGATTTLTATGLNSNASYDLYVIARSSYTTSSDSAHVTAWTLPTAPAAPAVGSVTDTSATVSWPAIPNATAYTVLRDGVAIKTITAPATSYLDAGLTAGTTYAYTLTVANPGGTSTASPSTTILTLPAAPTLTASAFYRTATLSWTASTSATGYELWRCPNVACTPGDGRLVDVYSDSTRDTSDAGLSDSTTYGYAMRAVNATGPGPFSPAQHVLTTPPVADAPTYSGISTNRVTLTWQTEANQAVNPSLETSMASWIAGGGRGTLVRDTSLASDGTASGRFVSTVDNPAPTNMYVIAPGNAGAAPIAGGFPVAAGQTVSAQVDVRGDGTSPTKGGAFETSVDWVWYDADGAQVGYVSRGAIATLDVNSWKTVSVTATVPDRAVRGRPLISNRTVGGSVTGDAFRFDNMRVQVPTDATTFKVYRDNDTTPVYTGPATTFTDTTLTPGSTYSYTVAAGNASGYSPVGPASTVTTVPGPVTGLTVSSTTSSTATLTWTPPPGTTGHKITVNGAPVATAGAAGSYTVTGLAPATTYTFGVAATTTGGTGAARTVTGTTRPAAPVGLVGTPGPGLGSVTLSWQAVPGATSYKITRDGNATSGACASATATTCTDTGLANATAYSYTVTAVGAGGDSDASNPTTVTTLAAAPTGVTATASGTTVTLAWTAPTGSVTGYKVYRCTGASCTATTTVGTAGTTTYTDPALTTGTTYRYQVTALTAGGGESAKSSLATTSTIPAAVTGLAAAGANKQATLTWAASPVATSYAIYRCAGTTCTPTLLTTTSSTSYTDTGLAGSSTYSYRVAAVNAAGTGAVSGTVTALTAPTAPLTNPATVTPTSVTVNWQLPAVAVTGFKVYRSGTLVATILDGSTTTWTDTALSANTAYTYTVSATNTSGEGDQSAPVTARTSVDTPTGLRATGATTSSVSLAWTAVTGATGYKVYTDGATPLTVTGAASTTATVTGLTPGTRFTFTVTALGTGFESDPSAATDAATTLGAPVGLTATGGTTQVTLTWTPVPAAAGYYLYRCAGTCTPTTAQRIVTLTSASASTYTNTALAAGTTYSYAIAAYTPDVTSGMSGAVSATTAPPTPAGLTAAATSATSINLSWAAAAGATGYKVYNGATVLHTGSAASATLTGLVPGTTYNLTVTATNAAGESAKSASVPALTYPAAPSLALTPGAKQVVATWDAPTSATSYTLARCAGTSCAPATSVYAGTALTHTSTALADNADYGFTITASNASGSTTSAVAYTTTLPGTPANLRTTDATPTSIALAWDAVAGAAGYQLMRDGQLVADLPADATSWVDEGPNVLSNAGFESTAIGANGIQTYNASTLTRDTASTRTGTASLRIATSSTTMTQGYIHFPTPAAQNIAPAGSTTTASVWVKAPAGTRLVVGGRTLTAAGATLAGGVNNTAVTATGTWQLVTVPAYTQTQDYTPGLEVRLATPASGITFWVDDADVANTALDNLLTRNVATGGDDTGTAAGFSAGSGAATLTISPLYDIAAATSKTSLRVLQQATAVRAPLASANRAANPGSSYQFTASARLADPDAGEPVGTGVALPVRARLTWLNESGATLSSVTSSLVSITTVRYTQMLVPASTAPAGAVTAQVSIELDGSVTSTSSAVAIFTDGWTLTSDVNPNGAYSYTIAAESAAGTPGTFSAATSGTTTPQPVDEAVLDVTGAQPVARWANSSAGTSYRVFTCTATYGSTCTPSWATPSATTANPYLAIATPAARSRVCFGVAVVSTVTGRASDPTSTMTCANTAPAAPAAPTRTSVATTGMTVAWVPAAPSAGLTYRVRLVASTGATQYACAGTSATSCTVTGLQPGTEYGVSVQAFDGAAASGWSSATAIVTTTSAPTLNGSLAGGTVTLGWTSAGPDVTYSIYRNGSLLASNLTSLSYSTPLPSDGTTYGYTVRASNGQGFLTGSSNTVSFVSVPPQPGAPTVTENANYTMSVTCPVTAGATTYTLWRKDGPAPSAVLSTGPSASFNDPGPFTGTVTYGYYCQASNASGASLIGPGKTTKVSYATSIVNGDKPDIYYKLNETPMFGAGYNYVADSSGNGNNGTLAGTLADVDFVPALARGSAGALGFGTGRYAYAALTGVTTTTPVTTEAWVTFPAATGTSSLMFTTSGTSLWLHPSGTGFGFTTGAGNLFGIPASAVTPLLGKTHHIVAVYGPGPGAMSSSTHKLYIDGVAQSLSLITAGSNAPAPKIGTTWGISSATAPWQGSFDNVAFYNSELSAATVSAHYNAANQVAAVAASSPLAHYKLDGAPMADSSGNGRAAGFVGDPDQTNRGGAIGFGTTSSLTLAGDVVSLPDLPVGTAPGQSTTVEFITSFAAAAENRMVFSFNSPDSTSQYNLYYTGAGFGFNTGASDLFGVPVSAVAGGAHRITATFYNGDLTNSKMWIDGVPQTLTQRAGTAGRTGAVSTDMQLGGRALDANYRWVNGVADLAVYRGTLTNAQVQAHQDGGDAGDNAAAILADNPIAFYRLGDFNVRDYSGWNRLGFLDPQSGANYGTPGALANSTDTGVTWAATSATGGTGTDRRGIRNVSPLADGSSDRTFEMWVKPGNMRLKSAFVQQGSWSYQKSNAFWFGRSSSAGANLALGDGSVNGTEIPAGALWDGDWHLLHVVVSNAGKTWTVYVDGAQTGSATFATGLTTAPGLLINGMNYAGDSGYTGAPTPMDEFAMYPTALTPAQITTHYNASK